MFYAVLLIRPLLTVRWGRVRTVFDCDLPEFAVMFVKRGASYSFLIIVGMIAAGGNDSLNKKETINFDTRSLTPTPQDRKYKGSEWLAYPTLSH